MTTPTDPREAQAVAQRQATCKHVFIKAHGVHRCVHCGVDAPA